MVSFCCFIPLGDGLEEWFGETISLVAIGSLHLLDERRRDIFDGRIVSSLGNVRLGELVGEERIELIRDGLPRCQGQALLIVHGSSLWFCAVRRWVQNRS